jgi:hypothetical protein
MRRLVQALFTGLVFGAPLLACSTSSSPTTTTASFHEACSGNYACTTSFHFLTYELHEDGITVFPNSADPTSCFVGTKVREDITVVMNADGTFTHGDTKIGTWTGTAQTLSACIGSVCTTCTDRESSSDELAPTCDANLVCDKNLPWLPTNLVSQFSMAKEDADSCSLSAIGGAGDVGSFSVESDGTLVAQGFPVGTWSGTQGSAQICILGECGACTAVTPEVSPDAAVAGDDDDETKPECESRVDCVGCNTCAGGRCVSCGVGTLGICDC